MPHCHHSSVSKLITINIKKSGLRTLLLFNTALSFIFFFRKNILLEDLIVMIGWWLGHLGKKIKSQVSTAPQSRNSPSFSPTCRKSLVTFNRSLSMTRKAPCCAIPCLRRMKLMFFALVIFIFSEIKHIKWLFLSCLRWEVSGVFLWGVLFIAVLQAQHVERKEIRLRKRMTDTIHRITSGYKQ